MSVRRWFALRETRSFAADALHIKWDAGLDGGMGITGKDTTPFLLASIAERTGGRSLEAKIQLVINNARVAADIAVEFAVFEN